VSAFGIAQLSRSAKRLADDLLDLLNKPVINPGELLEEI
jgi:hypothetical protein